jgi:hypothetical protein
LAAKIIKKLYQTNNAYKKYAEILKICKFSLALVLHKLPNTLLRSRNPHQIAFFKTKLHIGIDNRPAASIDSYDKATGGSHIAFG